MIALATDAGPGFKRSRAKGCPPRLRLFVTRTIPPVPPEFVQVFATGGWELVELLYGGRTDLHRKWLAMTGAVCRMPKRKRG